MRTVGRKGAREASSGGVQVFQLATEERGPEKSICVMAEGLWAVLVQSQRRQRFLMGMLVGGGLGDEVVDGVRLGHIMGFYSFEESL